MFASWDNYCKIFGIVLLKNVNMKLPVVWLYDMIDEFIRQYQSFCEYRAKLQSKSAQDIDMLRANGEAWNSSVVLQTLQDLVDKSGVADLLPEEFAGRSSAISNSESEDGDSNVLTMLGYYSVLGRMRLLCILGEYRKALAASDPARLAQRGALTGIPAVHAEAYYYMGFSYMMCQRYCDAIRCFNTLCAYTSRIMPTLQKSSKLELLTKTTEKGYALLAICLSLCPMRQYVEEGVMSQLREKQGEKMIKMGRMEEKVFDENFAFGCPKFVAAAAPDYSDPANSRSGDAYRAQVQLFMQDVKQFASFHPIRSQLAMYTSISMAKLAPLAGTDERALKGLLDSYKERTQAIQWSGEDSNLGGKMKVCTDIDFTIEDGIVHVVQTKMKSNSTDFLKRAIGELDGVTKKIVTPVM